jgi:hypothetical protein
LSKNNVDVIEIPATDLTKGMRVYRRDRFGNLKQDFSIGDPFTTSGPERFQPIAFNTDNGVKVFSLCATVEVGTGRKAETHKTGKRRPRNRKR